MDSTNGSQAHTVSASATENGLLELECLVDKDHVPFANADTDIAQKPSRDTYEEDATSNAFGDDSHVVAEMIDGVRNATGISHEKSQIAVQKVLKIIQSKCGQEHFELFADLASLLARLEEPSAISRVPEVIEKSRDARELKKAFNILSEITHDEQQRSWAVHEDEFDILEIITDAHSILLNADECISRHVMKSNGYVNVHTLALLYQMETRKTIRFSLRKVLITISEMDPTALATLANSILPMELGREFWEDSLTDRLRLFDISKLLTLLLSTTDTLPLSHFDYLDPPFVTSVLKVIEEESSEDDGSLQDELTNMLIALNSQRHGSNGTLSAISKFPTAPYFTQRLVHLLNWGKEPLPSRFNSVPSILIDIFQHETAAGVFYTNDVKVLVDVCIRLLTDLPPGDMKRALLLSLLQCILTNADTDQSIHVDRKVDLLDCFMRFFAEEEVDSEPCRKLILEIYKKFPSLKLKPTGESSQILLK